jgi:hypothetical protein
MNRIAINRIAANRIALGLILLFAFFSASCSSSNTDNAQNAACVTPAGARFVWVYYPGYGCGPLTPTGRGPFGG